MTNEEMVKAIKQGNREHIADLWEQCRRFIYHVLNRLIKGNPVNAARMKTSGITHDDLEQEAYFILLDAIEAFDISGGYTFVNSLSYATKTRFFYLIGMRTAKGRNDPLTNSDRLEREISIGGNTAPLGDVIADERATEEIVSIVEAEYQRGVSSGINSLLAQLEPQQSNAIQCHISKGMTFQETANIMNVSRKTAISLYDKGMRQLRKEQSINLLKPYYMDVVDQYAYRSSLGSFKRTWSSSTEITVMKLEEREKP